MVRKRLRHSRTVAALRSLINENRRLMRAMKQAARKHHGQGGVSAGRRRVMMRLQRLGPRTVPQLARSRSVSRQHMQLLVNDLVDQGLAGMRPNPAHRRSRLVSLTPQGDLMLHEMEKREAAYLSSLETGLSERRLKEAAETLRRLRRELVDAAAASPPGHGRKTGP